MKTAVSLPDDLFEAADRLAERLGLNRSQLYQRALAQFLNSQSKGAVTEALDRVYGSNGEHSALDPAVEWLQGASLAADGTADGSADDSGENW